MLLLPPIRCRGFSHLFLLSCTAVFITLNCVTDAEAKANLPVGHVLGAPLLRNDISAEDSDEQFSKMFDAVVEVLMKDYYGKHRKAIDPTAQEISRFMLYHKEIHSEEIEKEREQILKRIEEITDKLQEKEVADQEYDDLVAELYFLKTELEPPGHDYAMFVLPYWKLQLHIYNSYGKGRILWQERGYLAFDAIHEWLKLSEKEGLFLITDASLKKKFYSFWTSKKHGDYLISDKQRIRQLFTEPEWNR